MVGEGEVTAAHLLQLKKLSAFVNECLRFRSPAAILIPRVAVSDHWVKDVFVKKGFIN